MLTVSVHDVEPQAPEAAPEPAARRIFRECVTEVAANARQALPTANGRIDAAVKLVLQGDVERLPDGTARVASQSSGQTTYRQINGHCDCALHKQHDIK
jgi:hypothetical protein